MLAFGIITFVVAAAVFVWGQVNRKRGGTNTKARKKWAGSFAVIGLVLMSLGSIVFEGMESLQVWAIGLAIFFVCFFVERIDEIKKEMRKTQDIEH